MKGNRAQPFDLSRTPPPPVLLAEARRDGAREDFELEPAPNSLAVNSNGRPVDGQATAELAPLDRHFKAAEQAAPPPRAWPVYLTAAAVSGLWAAIPILYAAAYPRSIAPLQTNGYAIAAGALLVLGPVALIWIAAWLAQQGRALAAETRRARALAESLLAPAA
ncbi:MAG TPA: hypothetical protein VE309_10715, partial [Caulobacteraceae bacterium]|nr:hypothetical protein [Caulobacteraceae bacterium]